MQNVRSDLTATKLAFDVSFFDLVEAIIIALLEMTSVSKLSQFKQVCRKEKLQSPDQLNPTDSY